MILRILDEAEQDLLDGFRFYQGKAPGLGDYFLNSLFSDIDSLQLYAGMHPVHFARQRLLSKRFPFAIYYRLEPAGAEVWAVLDCRQDPLRIQKRLTAADRKKSR